MARILIMEDEPNLSCLYIEELESEGHQVVATLKNVDFLEEMPMDLVIFDLHLSQGEDLDYIREILARHPDLKIIINTSYPPFKDDFYSWCAERFVTKTSEVSEFKEAIDEVVEHS